MKNQNLPLNVPAGACDARPAALREQDLTPWFSKKNKNSTDTPQNSNQRKYIVLLNLFIKKLPILSVKLQTFRQNRQMF